MHLVAVGHLALGPLSAGLRCVATQETVETQTLHRQALNSLLDVGVGEDVADVCRVHPPADPTDVARLLFWR